MNGNDFKSGFDSARNSGSVDSFGSTSGGFSTFSIDENQNAGGFSSLPDGFATAPSSQDQYGSLDGFATAPSSQDQYGSLDGFATAPSSQDQYGSLDGFATPRNSSQPSFDVFSEFIKSSADDDHFENDLLSAAYCSEDDVRTKNKIDLMGTLFTASIVLCIIFFVIFFILVAANVDNRAFLIASTIGFFGMFPFLIFFSWRMKRLFKTGLVSPVLKYMYNYDEKTSKKFRRSIAFTRFVKQLYINRRWRSIECSDFILGSLEGVPFSFSDLRLTHQTSNRKHNSTITDFRGQIIVMPISCVTSQPQIAITIPGLEIDGISTAINGVVSRLGGFSEIGGFAGRLVSSLAGASQMEILPTSVDGTCSNGKNINEYGFKFFESTLLYTKTFQKVHDSLMSLARGVSSPGINVYGMDGRLDPRFCDALCRFMAYNRGKFKIHIMHDLLIIILSNNLDPFEIMPGDNKLDPLMVKNRIVKEARWLNSVIGPFVQVQE